MILPNTKGIGVVIIINVLQIIQDAVEDIYKKYHKMMKSLAYSILGDQHLSEDAVQEALLKLHQNSEKIDNVDAKDSRNYIYTVVRNEALTIKRKENKRNYYETDVQYFGESEFNNIEGQLDIDAFCNDYGFGPEISEVLKTLNLTDRDILAYKYCFGYSFKEIAKIMDMDRDAVYKRHKRALEKLRSVLEAGNGK